MTLTYTLGPLITATLLASPGLAQGQPALPGGLVRQGQVVEVIDDEGREIRGTVTVVSPTSFRLVHADVTTEILHDHVMQIARPNDSLANGALIGLAAGAGFGVLASTVGTDDCSDYYFLCPRGAGYVVGSTLIFGAIGAGIGVGIDALVRHDRIIYRRPVGPQTRVAPVVGRGLTGAMVAVSW